MNLRKMRAIFLMVFFLLVCTTITYPNLIDVYKKGPIKIEPDPEFGKNTDWDELFYQGIQDIAIAPDGRIFVAPRLQDKIIVLDKDGNYIKSFGQMGQGPSYFQHPTDLSILDDKYLVVGEYATNMRISLFDLDTNFFKLIRTSAPITDCVSLGKTSVAFLKHEYFNKANYTTTTDMIVVKDILTGNEVNVASFKKSQKKSIIKADQFYGRTFFYPFGGNQLLVGFTGSQEISFYTLPGQKTGSFNVLLDKKRVSSNMKEGFNRSLEKAAVTQPFIKPFLKERSNIGYPEFLPYYQWLAVDSSSNILVFKIEDINGVATLFQVYDRDGKPICESGFDFVGKQPSYVKGVHNDCFYFAIPDGDDDIRSRLIKVKPK